MSALGELCRQARGEFASLGELGRGLVSVVDAVEVAANGRGAEALADPGFALDVLSLIDGRGGAATVGRVLDFLRGRAGLAPVASARVVTVTEAVTAYEHGALALMAVGTGHTYRSWTRRLVTDLGPVDVAAVSAGDLTDVIARHMGAGRDGRRSRGRAAEENAVAAYRHLWAYLVEKGYARANLGARLRKPSRAEPNRRAIRADEAALLRHLARAGRDPLLDELTLSLAERLGLRRIEICRLRLCDLDLRNQEARVWGKGDKDRIMPIPPALFDLVERYEEDRRPGSCPPPLWSRRDDLLLRHRPTPTHPEGSPTGRRRIEELFARLGRAAPELFASGDLSLHSYRHALATYVDGRWGRAVTRAVLGHTSRRSPTDYYVHVDPDQVAEVLRTFEEHMLASDPICGDGRRMGEVATSPRTAGTSGLAGG